ncbi:hypothetical protein C815_00682 [Firmicutes bacterium M10-2]|nr:hypothetical protein C815_00682 [Firmicutes bacterium M10-2]
MIKVDNIKKRYPEFELDLDMEIGDNTITAILGTNGAGKTTLFKSMLGLIHLDQGTIMINGTPVENLTSSLKEKIGVIFPDSIVNEYLSIKEVQKILKASYSRFDETLFSELIDKFHLPQKGKIRSFSTGEKAKFKLICALTHKADLLILDEPTSGLDVIVREEILDMLRDFMKEEGHSIVISSHISSDLEHLCDDFYILNKGTICFHESMDHIDNYAILKASSLDGIDHSYFFKGIKTPYGWSVLTNQKQYYVDNFPNLIIEPATMDDIFSIVVQGETL